MLRLACQRALEGGHTRVVNLLWPLILKQCFVHQKYHSGDLEYDFADRAYHLMVAVAAYGPDEMLQRIISRLRYRVRPNIAAEIRKAMIQAAARHGNIDNLKALIFHRKEIDSALLEAASSGRLLLVQHLLKQVDIDPTSPNKDVPAGDVYSHMLAGAATHGHLDIITYLFGRGIAPTRAAITAAGLHDHTRCFQFLVRVLHETYKMSSRDIFSYIGDSGIPHCTVGLLESHPRPESLQDHDRQDHIGYIGRAARLGRVDVVKWLLGKGGRVADALGRAAEAGQMDVLEEVLQIGRPTKCDLTPAVNMALYTRKWDAAVRLQLEQDCGQYISEGGGKINKRINKINKQINKEINKEINKNINKNINK